MKKLFSKAQISAEGGILEAPMPFHAIFGLALDADEPREPKCDYDTL